MTIGIIALVVLTGMLILRVPVGIAMMAVGFVGAMLLSNDRAAFATLTTETFELANQLELMVIPFFVLMGNLASVSGLSRDLYTAAHALCGGLRGGLASATVVGCAGFSALSGSSVASALTIGKVAIPEMQRFKYDSSLSTGAVAAGGTLGMLIPPSTAFVIYGILTEQSIGKLFLAGVVPGIVLTGLYLVTIALLVTVWPHLAPRAVHGEGDDKLAAIAKAVPFVSIIVFTIGGIYIGAFTPMEAAAVGAIATFAVALARGSLTWAKMRELLVETGTTTATMYVILIGANVLTPFLARTGIPSALTSQMLSLDLGPNGTMVLLLAFYLVLGTFLEGFAILVLTLPVVYPLILALGFDAIWFGVMMVIVIELSLISPPVGMIIFVVKSIAPSVPMEKIFVGMIPFMVAMLMLAGMLLAWPDLALWLPNTMGR